MGKEVSTSSPSQILLDIAETGIKPWAEQIRDLLNQITAQSWD